MLVLELCRRKQPLREASSKRKLGKQKELLYVSEPESENIMEW